MDRFLKVLVKRYPDLAVCTSDIENAFELLYTAFANDHKLLLCGNGGSAADCEHITGELMKGFTQKRPLPIAICRQILDACPNNGNYLIDHLQGALPTISLVSQTSLSTAIANDVAAEMIFAQQVYGYGRRGDVVWGISTSGNSSNVLYALQMGRALDLKTLALTGPNVNRIGDVCDVTICVPGATTADVQERHLPVYHTLCAMLEEAFFGNTGSHA